ncbi:hypothetical protein KCX77_11200 [Bacillus atrophaeus]|nr:hypothetical protein KCX77_11200 [Bacillus atrophaeus]
MNERSVNSETGLTIFQEKLKYLVENDYYAEEFLSKYTFNQMKSIFKKAYRYKFRSPSFMSAFHNEDNN